jgi:prepilin peptidase CpaA
MDNTSLALCATALTLVAVGIATVTDLRWRRIPNLLTFPAALVGIVLRTSFQGWEGLALSVCGLIGGPVLLLLLHTGRGLGMGDIKLAAAVGAILGPPLTLVAMLLAAVAGGVLALGSQLRPGGVLSQTLGVLLIGLPGVGRLARAHAAVPVPTAPAKIPYGVGIAIGSLLTIVVYWCTENDSWFLWHVTRVASL